MNNRTDFTDDDPPPDEKQMMYFGEFNEIELNEARRIALNAVNKYGDLVGEELDRFRANPWNDHVSVQAALYALHSPLRSAPLDAILFCPNCGLQHVDAKTADWDNPPHRSHLCHGCTYVWRPLDVPTNGVAEIKTRGKNDAPRVRGRAPCVLTEQRRIMEIIKAGDWGGPRLGAIREAIIRNIRQRR